VVLFGVTLLYVAIGLWGVDSREVGHNPATLDPPQRKV
jgi:hypothetical protein